VASSSSEREEPRGKTTCRPGRGGRKPNFAFFSFDLGGRTTTSKKVWGGTLEGTMGHVLVVGSFAPALTIITQRTANGQKNIGKSHKRPSSRVEEGLVSVVVNLVE